MLEVLAGNESGAVSAAVNGLLVKVAFSGAQTLFISCAALFAGSHFPDRKLILGLVVKAWHPNH